MCVYSYIPQLYMCVWVCMYMFVYIIFPPSWISLPSSHPLRVNLESVKQTEVSQKEKKKYCILMHICGIQKNSAGEPICRAGRASGNLDFLFSLPISPYQRSCPLTSQENLLIVRHQHEYHFLGFMQITPHPFWICLKSR